MNLFRAPTKRRAFYVGLMSGTSADGIDAVVAELAGRGRGLQAKIRAHVARPFGRRLQERILHAGLAGTVAEICELNFLLGEEFARAAIAAIAAAKLQPAQIVAIGSHGQTVQHLPQARHPATLQIGEPGVIAERTGITTVGDFRVRDMAAGGQGAPLVPFADWALFTDEARPRIIQNLGGIGNLTFLPPRAKLREVVAFDTGPGNMVIDAVMMHLTGGRERFDRNGRRAARGKVSAALLAWCRRHPYLRRHPPKTTGREEFGAGFSKEFLRRGRQLKLGEADLVATATAFTADSIALAYERFVFPRINRAALGRLEVVLGGGGARNATLRQMLQERLPAGALKTHEDFGIASAAKEALAFAILAQATMTGVPGNVPTATGANRAVVLGKIVPA